MKNISIASVANSLKDIKSCLKKGQECEVRLQYLPDTGESYVHCGDPSYDTDHRGHWGSGWIDGKTNCRELAKYLLSQVNDSIADLEACERLKAHEEELMTQAAYDRACTCLPEIEAACKPRTCPCGSGLLPVDVGVNAPLLLCDDCFDQASQVA